MVAHSSLQPQCWPLLHDRLATLVARVDAIDVTPYETHAVHRTALELAPLTEQLLDEAKVLIADMLAASEARPNGETGALRPPSLPPPSLSFELALDAAFEDDLAWSATIGDVMFLAGIELRERSDRLKRIGSSSNEHAILAECDSALRRIRKALMTIEKGLDRAGFVVARLDFSSELTISLSVRRTYADLRRHVRAVGAPEPARLRAQLREVGAALATVVGWNGYTHLRIRDRMQIRGLQDRLLAWFRQPEDIGAGLHLWQDLDYFTQMLRAISRRQELREHDAQIVERVFHALSLPGAVLTSELRRELEELAGLDEEIDEALRADHSDSSTAWRQLLGMRHAELAPRSRRSSEPTRNVS